MPREPPGSRPSTTPTWRSSPCSASGPRTRRSSTARGPAWPAPRRRRCPERGARVGRGPAPAAAPAGPHTRDSLRPSPFPMLPLCPLQNLPREEPMKLLAPLVLASLVLLPAARAGGTIDATQYMPIGQFNAWEMIDKAQWADGAGIEAEPQIISIGNVNVVDGVVRYNIKSKLFSGVSDVVLQIGVDQGVLYLFGARLLDPEEDFGSDDITIPLVMFDQPVPLGDTTTDLDADFATTAVTASIESSIDFGPEDFNGDGASSGFVTARWNSVAAINTPLGLLGGVGEELAELQIDVDFTYFSTDDEIQDEIGDEHTVKG